MTAADNGPRAAHPSYYEPARTYLSSYVLLAVLGAGFCADLAIGGGLAHLWGWLLAVVVVVGVDVLGVHAARSMRSIAVTAAEVRVGDETVARDRILGLEQDVDPSAPVLGRTRGTGLPRGVAGLALHLTDGSRLVIPTRHPERLAAALEVGLEVPVVRTADAADLATIAEIQERAESIFRVAGSPLPPGWSVVTEQHDTKTTLVAGRPVAGFVRISEVDALASIELLAVLPGQMRRGLGGALVEAACGWAAAHGYPAITVTTYADIAWNGPWFDGRGFVQVDQLSSGMAELRDWEKAVGLDTVGRRVVMRRELADR